MIPLVDLTAQYRVIEPEIRAAVSRVLESSRFVLGEDVTAFEQEFSARTGAAHGVAVNSGTSALHLALLACDIGPGDEVITVPFTFVATVATIGYVGARTVFVDIDPESYTMQVAQLEAAVTSRTKAIVPVHLYGQPADLDPILQVARRHGLAVIEDAAQAHLAEYRGQPVGGIGDIGCFSFYPGKNLGAYGEGGMAVTNDPALAQTMRRLRDWGQERKYVHVLKGYNYRMEALQGAMLRVKLGHLDAWTRARRAHATRYGQLLAEAAVGTPQEMPYAQHVYHVYAVRTARREELEAQLQARGVGTAIHYPTPVYLQPAYADLGYHAGDFPNAERAAREVLSLPMFPELSPDQLAHVASSVCEAAAGAAP